MLKRRVCRIGPLLGFCIASAVWNCPAEELPKLEDRVFRLAYISPEDARFPTDAGNECKPAAPAQSLLDLLVREKGLSGTISFEKRSNALVVRDVPANLDKMQSIIDHRDQPERKILLQPRADANSKPPPPQLIALD